MMKEGMEYSMIEERLNISTHAFGLLAAFIATGMMIADAEGFSAIVSSWIFGITMVVLYAASTSYHAATNTERRKKLRVFDHAAIYLLIAGTYTPVCLLTLSDSVGPLVLWIIWPLAIMGILLKIFFTGRFKILSTLLYVGMGWIAVFAANPLMAKLDPVAIEWLLFGGLSYTVGAVLYAIKAIPYNHAIFHLFVLGGTYCHFICIYKFVI